MTFLKSVQNTSPAHMEFGRADHSNSHHLVVVVMFKILDLTLLKFAMRQVGQIEKNPANFSNQIIGSSSMIDPIKSNHAIQNM